MAATTPRANTPHLEPFPPLNASQSPRNPLLAASTTSNTSLKPPSPQDLHNRRVASLSPKSTQPRSPRVVPVELTGQAAQASMAEAKRRKLQQTAEDARRTSPNPAVEAMQNLMRGPTSGFSRPSDAPTSEKLSEPMRQAAESMIVTDSQDPALQASPTSMSSFGTLESSGPNVAMTATANHITSDTDPQFVAEPAEMGQGEGYANSTHNNNHNNGHLAVAGEDGSKAFSYPGPPPQVDPGQDGGPSRGMSLPGYGQDSPKSPASSNKRHKCPYCSTDFTRHHNLKSHLLTHSQEKHYICQTCSARFRRLHDLKRHSKLHTGEKNHTCDKCGRKFARGDALARHNKGPGGCAGRRSSFGADDEYGDGTDMEGVEYTGDDGNETDHGRRVSEPNRKRPLDSHDSKSRETYRMNSTYPPPQQPPSRPHASSVSSMGPPQVVLPGSNQASSPRDAGLPSPAGGYYNAGGQVFGQSNMIESPKPLSPGQPPDQHRLSVGDASVSSMRNRSPSLTTQFQQQHFGRGNGGRTPPQPSAPFTTGQPTPLAPVLPPLHGNHNSTRPALQPSSVPAGMVHLPQSSASGGQMSNPGSLSSHGRSSGSSFREVVGHEADLWNYVRTLEQRVGRMQDEYELRISRLQEEVISLRGQVSASTNYGGEMNQPRYS